MDSGELYPTVTPGVRDSLVYGKYKHSSGHPGLGATTCQEWKFEEASRDRNVGQLADAEPLASNAPAMLLPPANYSMRAVSSDASG